MKLKYNIIKIVISLLLSFSVNAGSFKTGNPERERSSKEAMTETFYKKFEKLQIMYTEGQFEEAKIGFLKLIKNKSINSFEIATTNQFLGYIASATEKYVEASNFLTKSINTDALVNAQHFGMMRQKAQILAGGEKYKMAITALKEYYAVVDEVEDSTYYLEASLYAQLGNFKSTIAPLKKAISLADKQKEPWYNLLYAAHMNLSEFKQAAEVMKILIKLNPDKKSYWMSLYQINFTLKKDKEALAILAIAYKNNLFDKEEDHVRLYKLYSYLEIPYEAAKVLDKALKQGIVESSYKNWDSLGKSWYAAAEIDNALIAYNEASKLATDGKIDFQRAYVYFDREEWSKAKTALLAAIEKGGLKEKRIGTAWLLIGMSESELNKPQSAIAYFKKAKQFKNRRADAIQWINHLKDQIKRKKATIDVEKELESAFRSEG